MAKSKVPQGARAPKSRAEAPAEKPGEDFDQDRFIHESLVEICDLLSEALAEADEPGAIDYQQRIGEINSRVWKLRWELGMNAGESVSLVAPNMSTAGGAQ